MQNSQDARKTQQGNIPMQNIIHAGIQINSPAGHAHHTTVKTQNMQNMQTMQEILD